MSLNTKIANILIVDDNELNLDLLCKVLTKANFQISTAINGIDAVEKVSFQTPELILLDVMMPKLDGFEVCKLLKQNPETENIPIIFMTSLVEKEKIVEAFQLGASDYITKPFQKTELLARVKSHLEVFNLRQTLENQNHTLQHEINQKYEVEISLLEMNEYLKHEIKNRKAVELKLQQSLKEKDLLLKEIHHRVKNNLFIVSSLLESQADYTDDPQTIKILENSQNRIMSMALIHEQLHGNRSLSQIDFQQYLIVLTEHLIDSYFTQEINFQSKIQEVYLNIETAHPCGLIINELISNAVEHAFPEQKPGNILLEFNQDQAGNFNLLLKDDGIGFPAHKDFYHSESLGLELVSTLVEQLAGEIKMNNNNGTEVRITFKELNYQSRI